MGYDYSKIKIYQDNTTNKETRSLNERLMTLYKKWFYVMHKNGLNSLEKLSIDNYKLNGMQLLTAFDSYVQNTIKIMTFGKEAHTNNGEVTKFNMNYQRDEYYSYDYAIAHRYDKGLSIPAKEAPNTFYLKARKIISGIYEDNSNLNEKKVLSILNNNLNKTSFSGRWTPCSKNAKNDELRNSNLDNIVYSKFPNEDLNANIFLHEINILKPTHIVLLCGKGYDKHIERAFGKHFLDKLQENNKNLSINNPCGKVFEIPCIELGLPDSNYDKIKIIQTIHPNAHLGNKRIDYHNKLKDFCGYK